MVAKVVPEERRCPVCPVIFLVGGEGNGKREKVYCSWSCRSRAKVNTNGKRCKDLSIAEAAYLAGAIDADGYVGLYIRSRDKNYRLTVGLTNSHHGVLAWAAGLTDVGSVQVQFRGSEKRKTTWVWTTTSGAAGSLLAQIAPHMHVKKERAMLGIDFWNRSQDPVLWADKAWQHEFKARFTEMNQRGPGGQRDGGLG